MNLVKINNSISEYIDNVKNFCFDVGIINGKMFLVEINEIHLSTIDSSQLQFILKNIL